MARLSSFSADKKRTIAQSSKNRHFQAGRGERAADERQRKPSMDAYYRPRYRGFIDACLQDADETETDVTFSA